MPNTDQEVHGQKLTPQEVGAILQLHPDTVIRFAKEGRIPGKNFGTDKRSCWRFARQAIDALIPGGLTSPSRL